MSTNKIDNSTVYEMFEKIIERLNRQPEKPVEKFNQSISKEEIEKIVHEKTSALATFMELKIKQQTNNQTNIINKELDTMSFLKNVSFSQPKKIAFFGFEFLRTSVVIFVLSMIIFWLLVMNIKQMDNYQALKTQNNQLTEYVNQMQQAEKPQDKSRKAK